MSLRDWLSLVRIEFPLMTLVGVAAGASVASRHFEPAFLLAGLGPALITAASFILNDFFDVKSDAFLKRADRPIAAGRIKPKQALYASAGLFLLGLAACMALSGPLAFAIAFAYCVLAVAYDVFLKRTLFAGNAAVATTYAIPFVYGNAIAINSLSPGALDQNVLVFAGVAFLAGLARELFNSVKDKAGDRKLHALSLPMLLGDRAVIAFGSLLLLAAVALSAVPLLAQFNPAYALLVGACDALLLASAYSALKNHSYASLNKARKHTIYALLLGLAGFASLAF